MDGITVEEVKNHLGITPADTFDDDALTTITAATNAYISTIPVVANLPTDTTELPPDITLGAVMLAARWYRRRNSPEGLVSYGDMGGVTVPRLDADIERLFRIGRYAPMQAR